MCSWSTSGKLREKQGVIMHRLTGRYLLHSVTVEHIADFIGGRRHHRPRRSRQIAARTGCDRGVVGAVAKVTTGRDEPGRRRKLRAWEEKGAVRRRRRRRGGITYRSFVARRGIEVTNALPPERASVSLVSRAAAPRTARYTLPRQPLLPIPVT